MIKYSSVAGEPVYLHGESVVGDNAAGFYRAFRKRIADSLLGGGKSTGVVDVGLQY